MHYNIYVFLRTFGARRKNPIVSAGQNFLKRGTFATVVKHNFLD